MWNDVIKYVQQVTEANSNFELENNNPFYLFLAPRDSNAPATIVLYGTASNNKLWVNIPFCTNQWNPILINRLDIRQDIINQYNVFIGKNY